MTNIRSFSAHVVRHVRGNLSCLQTRLNTISSARLEKLIHVYIIYSRICFDFLSPQISRPQYQFMNDIIEQFSFDKKNLESLPIYRQTTKKTTTVLLADFFICMFEPDPIYDKLVHWKCSGCKCNFPSHFTRYFWQALLNYMFKSLTII